MKKLMALVIALTVVVIAGAAVMAEEVGSQGWKPKIRTMSALGYGIATSQTNAMDFELLKIGIAGVSIDVSNESEEIKVGILYFGEIRYKLKDIAIGNGTASANIYDSNSTNVGSISLNSYPKGDTEVWAGTLALNGVNYNAYVIQANRPWKPAEKADNIKEYCKNNPGKCMATMKAVGQIICDPQNNESCRDKIKTFCEQYPDDNRCKVLSLTSCRFHLEDSNCRAELMQKCKENSTAEGCDNLANIYNKYTENRTELMKNAPAWLKNITKRLENRRNAAPGNEEGD